MSTEATGDTGFSIYGFLTRDIQETIDHVTGENPEWFSLLRDINQLLQKIVISGFERHHGNTMDVKVLTMFSALRSLSNFQSAIMNLERGMVVEARIMARCLYENSFCIGALVDNPDTFIPLLKHDNVAAKRGQAVALKEGSYSLTADVEAAMDERISGDKGKHLKWKYIAELSSLSSNYLMYKHLSDDAMHYSASSLKRYIVSDKESNTWSGYRFGPATKDEVIRAANFCVSPTLAIMIGFLEATDDTSYDREVNLVLDRFTSITSKGL
ncbi:hypothetical protein AEQ67_11735 [Pseudomonas sp. RIT-PI-q]|uniref:DUF5677 domain-containing protein n=1 Tax=Pseudomonas sp. RIT-PI-q TaxID=1690247 RepID=UPI0006CD55BA|nr:DUF5677 domain-containing protein [Pseudomonas sp. RIT-PI-q]KPG99052.1 hypothetical protein AEQ67_11735 [Pseudomonas sp. RIT-PI-q]